MKQLLILTILLLIMTPEGKQLIYSETSKQVYELESSIKGDLNYGRAELNNTNSERVRDTWTTMPRYGIYGDRQPAYY